MTTSANAAVDDVVGALNLDPTGPDTFVGPSVRIGLPRVFGGQVLAQALIAAARTAGPATVAHSMHAYFLRPGDPDRRLDFTVGRVRDGRRFHCRTVTATQADRPIATATVSFTTLPADPAAGRLAHQIDAPPSPPPEGLPTLAESVEAWGGPRELWTGLDAVELRIAPPPPADPAATGPNSLVWMRMAADLPADPLLHQALVAYLSDVTTLSAALVPLGVPIGIEEIDGRYWDGISLDHAIWFHRPAAADEWLLFAQSAPSAGQGRALSRADVFTRDGTIAASLAQEGLYVPRD